MIRNQCNGLCRLVRFQYKIFFILGKIEKYFILYVKLNYTVQLQANQQFINPIDISPKYWSRQDIQTPKYPIGYSDLSTQKCLGKKTFSSQLFVTYWVPFDC